MRSRCFRLLAPARGPSPAGQSGTPPLRLALSLAAAQAQPQTAAEDGDIKMPAAPGHGEPQPMKTIATIRQLGKRVWRFGYRHAFFRIADLQQAVSNQRKEASLRLLYAIKKSRLKQDLDIKSNPLITVFGSCRQDSISQRFRTTRIRDDVNYCHYTKEVLQLIGDLRKGEPTCNSALYRVCLEGHTPKEWSEHVKEFDDTDVFVVEIASSYAYEVNGFYSHHTAYDREETRSCFPGISRRRQTDDEIRDDMERIRDELAPRPVIFVSHVCTYNSGTRARLRELVRDTALGLDCLFFDPSSLFESHPASDLLIEQDTANHFTPKGHSILARHYSDLIFEALKQQTHPCLVQAYPDAASDTVFHGLGDFLQGAAFLHDHALKLGIKPKISLSGTALSKWIYNTYPLTDEQHASLNRCYSTTEIAKLPALYKPGVVFTNHKSKSDWTEETVLWVKTMGFRPKPATLQHHTQRLKKLGLSAKGYQIVHVRLGDDYMCPSEGLPYSLKTQIARRLEQISGEARQQIVLLSDRSGLFSELAWDKKCSIIASDLAPSHLGKSPNDEQIALTTVLDLLLMSSSTWIHSVSTYEWGSGFCQIASSLFTIPLSKHPKLSDGEP